jgi:hypothetical protein
MIGDDRTISRVPLSPTSTGQVRTFVHCAATAARFDFRPRGLVFNPDGQPDEPINRGDCRKPNHAIQSNHLSDYPCGDGAARIRYWFDGTREREFEMDFMFQRVGAERKFEAYFPFDSLVPGGKQLSIDIDRFHRLE